MDVMQRDHIDVVPIIEESAQYKKLSISINDLEVRSQDVIDLQINYNDLIKGKMSFVDNLNLAEFAPLTFAILNVSFIDNLDNVTDLTFMIVDAEVLRLKNNGINITIKFEEVTTAFISNTYLSKSFKNKTMLQMIEELLTDYEISGKFIGSDDDYVYPYFVIPNNISLLDFIKQQSKYSSFRVIADRDGLTFISFSLLDYSKLLPPEELDFTINRDSKYPYWNIIEYQGQVSRVKEFYKTPKANLSNTIIQDLKYTPQTIDSSTEYPRQELNGSMGAKDLDISNIKTFGKKEISHIFHNEVLGEDMDYNEIIKGLQRIKISVQGLSLLRMYGRIKLTLPRAVGVQTQQSDEVFSGEYVVVEVIDKIISGNYIQFLTLQASDYSPGSSQI